jgi:flagellin
MNSNARGLATVMQQLSTGKRINNAVDDVAGLAISTRLTSQINGLNQAVRNANDGISLIQTAEGSTQQVTNMLQRMRELAVQASNDTNNSSDRGFLDGEFQQLKQEIDRVGQNTQWNGANILDGTGGNNANGTFAFQVGANSDQTISIKLGDLQTAPAAAGAAATAGTAITAGVSFNGGATADFTSLDTTSGAAAASVGLVVQTSFDGKAVQYKITQADVDATTGANGTTTMTLSATVTDALVAKLNVAFGSAATAAESGGIMTVTPSSNSTVTFTTANSGGAHFETGDLSVIASSSITTAAGAYSGLQAIDSALQTVNAARSNMGAVISRLQFASDNLSNISTQAQASESRIVDTDYSMATTELAKRNIIQQAAQAMLAQANQQPQMVLQLLK